jgi:hypothetical protein
MIDTMLNVRCTAAESRLLPGASQATDRAKITGFVGYFARQDLVILNDQASILTPPPPLGEA